MPVTTMLAQQPYSRGERRVYAPARSVALDGAPSRVSRPALRASRRADIFWEVATPTWTVSWENRQGIEFLISRGYRPRPWVDLSVSEDQATRQLWERRQAAPPFVRLRILSAVLHWRVLTTQQIASFVGTNAILSDLTSLWQAGLVWRGGMVSKSVYNKAPSEVIWRAAPDAKINRLLRRMTASERLGLLGGAEWGSTVSSPGHDLTVADLSLRAAELAPQIAAVYGEALSTQFKVSGVPGNARGDATWVRSDGLKVVVELSGGSNKDTRTKVDRWVRVLTEDKSLVVLFVVGGHPSYRLGQSSWMMAKCREGVSEAAWSQMSSITARAPERIGVVSLTEWFPEPMRVAPDFGLLPAWRPTGKPGDRFERAYFGDAGSVTFDPDDAGGEQVVMTPVRNAAKVFATPWWLVREQGPKPKTTAGFAT